MLVDAVLNHLDDKFYLVHAASGQNAFRNDVNGFDTLRDAMDFADYEDDCDFHEFREFKG